MPSSGRKRPILQASRRSGAARAAASLGLALALSGCGPGGAQTPPEEPKPVTVEVATVAPQLLRDVATFSGQLSAENSVMIKSETDGVIERVLFDEGQSVEQGTVLFELRDDEQAARLREAEANLLLAQDVYSRTRQLVTRDAASAAQKDRAIAELSVAKARVELARVELARTRIRAPFDGVLGVRRVARGDRISDETPLVQIDAIDRLQVAFAISDIGILFARVGARVEVKVAPYPGEVFPGEVFYVSPSLDPETRRVIVKAWIPNEQHRLRAGLFANVDLVIDTRENAILVPESAVVFDQKGPYVWRVDAEGVATRVPIEVGLRKQGRVEVTLGLEPGDTIVTAGTHKVSEGRKVIAAAPRSAAMGQARKEARTAGEGA